MPNLQDRAVTEVTLQIKAQRSFETSVIIYQSKQRNIPEDYMVQNNIFPCQNSNWGEVQVELHLMCLAEEQFA